MTAQSTAPASRLTLPDATKDRLRLWLRILKLERHVEAELRERLRVEFSSTLPRFDVLAALARSESGLRMSEISSVLRVSNGNVTGIVDRLVEDGLVARLPVEGDRRAHRIQLTDTGTAHFEKLATAHAAWIDEMFLGLSAEEADGLSQHLDTLITAMPIDGKDTP